MRNLVLVLSAFILSVSHAHALPTPEQRTSFEGLSPQDAAYALQAVKNRLIMENWDTVTRIALTRFVHTTEVRDLEPVDDLGWNTMIPLGEKFTVSWGVTMPKTTATPFDVQIEWSNGGKIIQLKTHSVDKPSPNYRHFDSLTVRREGPWTVRILVGDTELVKRTFVAR